MNDIACTANIYLHKMVTKINKSAKQCREVPMKVSGFQYSREEAKLVARWTLCLDPLGINNITCTADVSPIQNAINKNKQKM